MRWLASCVALFFVLAISPLAIARDLGEPDPLEILPQDGSSPTANVGPLSPIAVPNYHSDSLATHKLYLNFIGETSSGWGQYSPGTTPAYDADGDTTTFSSTELSNINQIWQRVSEKYSPFNIDVTTERPQNFSPGTTLQVVIGGKGSWYPLLAGGVSYVGSFPGGPNTAYVFSDNLAQSNHGVPKYVAEAASHEAGHAFGLYHQSDYALTTDPNTGSSTYTKSSEYSLGTYNFTPGVPGVLQPAQPGSKSPIMGNSYYAERGVWWTGPSSNASPFAPYAPYAQSDLDIISSQSNGLGYRPDGPNNSFAQATPLTIDSSGIVHASGVIELMDDKDYFSFDSAGGLISLLVNVAPFGPMLDASVQLYDSNGQKVAESATSSLSELLTANVSPGSYDLVIYGAGQYGDLGQYFISGSLGTLIPEPAALAILMLIIPLSRPPRRSRLRVSTPAP